MRYALVILLFISRLCLAQPPTPDVRVVNTADNPIPVTGEISAEVLGSVTVDDVPDELTDRLDLVLDRLDAIVESGSSGQATANFVRQRRFLLSSTGVATYILNETVAVSTIIVSAENDNLFLLGCADPTDPCTGTSAQIVVGSLDQEFPVVQTINFPDRVPLTKLLVSCRNFNGENCEIRLTVVGMVLE